MSKVLSSSTELNAKADPVLIGPSLTNDVPIGITSLIEEPAESATLIVKEVVPFAPEKDSN